MDISGHTGLLALIGSPVGHSGSPAMYNYSFQKLGLDYVYVAFDVKEEDVPKALDAMRLFGMRGMNVTMPDKTAAAENCDELSHAAKIVGAVNTIVNENGKLVGHMTDGQGFVDNLKDNGVAVKGKKVVICGGGGAASAIQAQLALDGVTDLVIFNRKDAFFQRTLAMAEKISAAVPSCKVSVHDLADTAALTEETLSADIFINATIIGMKPNHDTESVLNDPAAFHEGLVVADTVYNPVETKLLADARAHGLKAVGGKGMLLWQGAAAFRLYTGKEMPVEEVKALFFS